MTRNDAVIMLIPRKAGRGKDGPSGALSTLIYAIVDITVNQVLLNSDLDLLMTSWGQNNSNEV